MREDELRRENLMNKIRVTTNIKNYGNTVEFFSLSEFYEDDRFDNEFYHDIVNQPDFVKLEIEFIPALFTLEILESQEGFEEEDPAYD